MQGLCLVHLLTPTVPGTNYYDNDGEDDDDNGDLESRETDYAPGSV